MVEFDFGESGIARADADGMYRGNYFYYPDDEGVTEAEAIRQWLVGKSIEPDDNWKYVERLVELADTPTSPHPVEPPPATSDAPSVPESSIKAAVKYYAANKHKPVEQIMVEFAQELYDEAAEEAELRPREAEDRGPHIERNRGFTKF